MKTCGKCGEEKPLDGFSSNRANADGRQAWCKACWRSWRQARRPPPLPEEPWPDSERCKACAEVKPLDAFSRQARCKYGRRPVCKECRAAAIRLDRAANLESHRAKDRARYATNPQRQAQQKATARKRYRDNIAAIKAYAKTYYLANPEVYERARQKRMALERGAEHQPYSRREIYERDGGRCRGCHVELEYKPYGFEIDHIVPISLGGPDIPANVQLMCFPCNRAKWATLEGQIHMPV